MHLLWCVVKSDANNGFLTETDCSDISAKDIWLKFTTALNKSHHLDLCINRRPAQSADPPGDSLSLFLSSDLHQHRPDVLRCTSSTSGTECRHRRLPDGAEDVIHERRSDQPQRLDLLQQTGCGGRGDQRGLINLFIDEHFNPPSSCIALTGREEIRQRGIPWLRQGVLGAATVPDSCSSDDEGLTAERYRSIKQR